MTAVYVHAERLERRLALIDPTLTIGEQATMLAVRGVRVPEDGDYTPRMSELELSRWLNRKGMTLQVLLREVGAVCWEAIRALEQAETGDTGSPPWLSRGKKAETALFELLTVILTGAVVSGEQLHAFWRAQNTMKGVEWGPRASKSGHEHPWQRDWRELRPQARVRFELQVAITRTLAPEGLFVP